MFKPMLAGTLERAEQLRLPVLASPKLDGVRAMVQNGVLVSRKLKPIPNIHVQQKFGRKELNGFDGELICGHPCAADCFRKTMSAVMSEDGQPDVDFHLFDRISHLPFSIRLTEVRNLVRSEKRKDLIYVPHLLVESVLEFDAQELAFLAEGYEGIMLRDPGGQYKQGRSTLREGWLLKYKRFLDGEAEVLGMEEMLHNDNELERDNLGHAKRSSHKAGMKPAGMMGMLYVKDLKTGVEFGVGTGFDRSQRIEIWSNKAKYLGQIISYRYFPMGSKDKPRFPKFHGFRDIRDI